MTEKFSDLLQFTTQVSRLMVTEIRRRASNKSTGIFTETRKNYLNRLFGKSAIKIKEKIDSVLSMWVLITCPRFHSHTPCCWWVQHLPSGAAVLKTIVLGPPIPTPALPRTLFPSEQIQIPSMTLKANPGSGCMKLFLVYNIISCFLFYISTKPSCL